MSKKRKLRWQVKAVLAALGSVACMTGVTAVSAYYTAHEKSTNTVTPATNEITVVEKFNPPTELKVGANTYQKEVQIKNTGNSDTYVRVFCDVSEDSVRDTTSFSSNGTSWYSIGDYRNHLPDNWSYITTGDLAGYYYYTLPVKAGASTTALVKQIKTEFSKEEDIKPYDVIVSAESIQIRDKYGQLFTGADAWKSAWTEFVK